MSVGDSTIALLESQAGQRMKLGKRIIAAAGLALAGVWAASAAAEDGAPGHAKPFDLIEPLGNRELGALTAPGLGLPGPFPGLETTASGEVTCTPGEVCTASITSNVVHSQDLAVGSFNTHTRVSATNILTSHFGVGSITLGDAAADAAAGAAAQ